MKSLDRIMCPLIEQEIESIDCIENADAVDGMIKKESVPSRFKAKANWEKICKNCKWHGY